MEKEITEKINLLLLGLGGVSLVYIAVLSLGDHNSIGFFLHDPFMNGVLAVCLLLIWGHLFWKAALKYLHILIVSLVSAISILFGENQYYGIGQVIIFILLMYKYGFLEKYIKIKLALVSLSFIALTEISILQSGLSDGGIEIFIYVPFFFSFLYIVFKDEIDDVIRRNGPSLTQDPAGYREQAANLETRLDEFGLTKREKKIVKILVTRNLTNKEIAALLGIKEQTVKTHLYHVFNKIGVDSRTQLIGLFYPHDDMVTPIPF